MPNQGRKQFNFFVDDKQFKTEDRYISGSQLRALAQIDPSFQLFLEERDPDKKDREVGPNDSIDLESPGVEKFYSVPPATFGA